MLAALLLFQAAPQTAIDAERAFNRAAQTQGQWTAFRAFMAPDATVFTPQPEKAATALPTKNPPIAVQWWPAASFVSCDGKTAVNTGPWVRPNSFGYFTTVWEKRGAWQWTVDAGDDLKQPRPLPEHPRVHAASCKGRAALSPPVGLSGATSDQGVSADGTLMWRWHVWNDGARSFEAFLWNGRRMLRVLSDQVEAPARR